MKVNRGGCKFSSGGGGVAGRQKDGRAGGSGVGGDGVPVFSPTPSNNGDPSHPLLMREEWRPAVMGVPLSRASVTGKGAPSILLTPLLALRLGDQGLGNQDRAPWRLSTIPCCSELKMALREPTNTVRLKVQAWEAGGPRGGPGAFEDPE